MGSKNFLLIVVEHVLVDITVYCQTCVGCQSTVPSKKKPPSPGLFEVPDDRFSHVHIDIVGPLPESEGFKFLLTTMDRTTRFFSAIPVKDTSAKTCSQAFLLNHVAMFGIPSACTSDRGSNFVSDLFHEMQRGLGIEAIHTPIYLPQGNGLIERQHQVLKNSLKAQIIEMANEHQENWCSFLPWTLLGMRTSFNKNLHTSSAELAFGLHPQIPAALAQPVKFDQNPNVSEILKKVRLLNNRTAIPTSTNDQPLVDPPGNEVTHVHTKQHNKKRTPKYV